MTDATSSEAVAAQPPAAKKSGLTTVFLILNSVLLAAVLGVVLLRQPGAAAAHPGAEAHDKPAGAEGALPANGMGPTLRLADFVIHLRNPEVDRYARLSFEIEVGTEKDKEVFTPRLPQIREAFIAYLSDRTAEDLRGSDGIEKTKQALMAKLTALAQGTAPRAIYITDLVIQ